MRIEKINVYKASLPFQFQFSISRMKRLSSTLIVVQVIANQGNVEGYGEGIPLDFITGETPESVIGDLTFLLEGQDFPWEPNNIEEIWDYVDQFPDSKTRNTALCAVEMALLDALSQNRKKPLMEHFSKVHATDKITYGAIVTIGDKKRIEELCRIIRRLGIKDIRIKMGNSFEQNRDAIDMVRKIAGEECELRIDPNGIWNRDLAMKHIPIIEDYNVRIVEEPMSSKDSHFPELAERLKGRGVRLMACETALTLADVKRIVDEGYYHMINVKLCRNGGFRKCFRIINYLRDKGIDFQIGCSIGESGILSAAGRTLGLLCGDAKYYDGSYDAFLLKENVTVEDVGFGERGEAGPLKGPGLGIQVDTQKLKRLGGGAPVFSASRDQISRLKQRKAYRSTR